MSYQCHDTDQYPYSDPWSGSPPKFNHLFTGPFPILSENFMQICSKVFAHSCWWTNRQTNNDDYITSLAEVINKVNCERQKWYHSSGTPQKCHMSSVINNHNWQFLCYGLLESWLQVTSGLESPNSWVIIQLVVWKVQFQSNCQSISNSADNFCCTKKL